MVFDFVYTFFCRPILEYSGYNPVNTLVYGVILLVIAFGLVLPWLRRNKLPLDHRFLLALIPFIVFGSSFRILEDLGLLERSCDIFSPWFYTITPGIYLLTASITILALAIGLRIGKENKTKALKVFAGTGMVLAAPVLLFVLTQIVVWLEFVGIFVMALVLTSIAVYGSRIAAKTKPVFEGLLNRLVFFGQMLDASATFTALQFFNCGEQHVLSGSIINFFGPTGFVIVKFVLIFLVLYFADKEIENPVLRNFIKIVVAIIGFAPGIRDALTLGVGTCL